MSNRRKSTYSFSFKDMTHQQMVDHLNDEYPISIKYNEELVNRVYACYPLIPKAQVGMIVKAVFSCMRDLLTLGKVLSFHKLLMDVKLLFWPQHLKGKTYGAMKTQLTTPAQLRRLK